MRGPRPQIHKHIRVESKTPSGEQELILIRWEQACLTPAQRVAGGHESILDFHPHPVVLKHLPTPTSPLSQEAAQDIWFRYRWKTHGQVFWGRLSFSELGWYLQSPSGEFENTTPPSSMTAPSPLCPIPPPYQVIQVKSQLGLPLAPCGQASVSPFSHWLGVRRGLLKQEI